MSQTVTLQLSDETLDRYQRGAIAARKPLEEFLVERLIEALPPLANDLPSPVREELQGLERLNDDTLRQIAKSQLPPASQRQYHRLLVKNTQGTITEQEKETLYQLGEQARLLSLKAAHAYMVLKWRGHHVPSLAELQQPE